MTGGGYTRSNKQKGDLKMPNKNILEALDSFSEYIHESTSGDITKKYNKNADRIVQEQKALGDDVKKQIEKIQSEYKEKLESDDNSELLILLNDELSSDLAIGELVEKTTNKILNGDSDEDDLTVDSILPFESISNETILEALDSLLKESSSDNLYSSISESDNEEDKPHKLFDKFAETSMTAEEKKEKDALVSHIEKLKKENDEVEKRERLKYLILAIASFGVVAVFGILMSTVPSIIGVASFFESVGVVAGIAFFVLRAKMPRRNRKVKANEEIIKKDEKRLNEIKDAQKIKLAKKLKELKLDCLKKEKSVIEKYEKQSDKLSSELKEIGKDATDEFEAKENKLMSGVSEASLRVFSKVKEMPVKFQYDFIDECKIRNVQSENEMLDVYKGLKKDFDEETARQNREENERLANEEMLRQAQEQAEQARRISEEQNRLLRQQADAQERQQRQAKENGERFRTTMCYKCKNYAGCGAQWHLTGPCPSFTQK